jgi:HEAT repeat protein
MNVWMNNQYYKIFIFIFIMGSLPVCVYGSTKWAPTYQKKSFSEKAPSSDDISESLRTNEGDISEQESVGKEKKKSLIQFVHKDLKAFYQDPLSTKQLEDLKSKALSLQGQAVRSLIVIMKDPTAPDRSRWVVTFLIGKIMGKKSGNFLVKYLYHPHWVLRLASLKTLYSLKENRFIDAYIDKLKDSSFIVRVQALEVVSKLQISQAAPQVWSMLFDESNYVGQKGKLKRSSIIKQAIRTLGDLRYEKAKTPLLSMIMEKKYEDVFDDLDYGLGQIMGKGSPEGNRSVKRIYWSRISMSEKDL